MKELQRCTIKWAHLCYCQKHLLLNSDKIIYLITPFLYLYNINVLILPFEYPGKLSSTDEPNGEWRHFLVEEHDWRDTEQDFVLVQLQLLPMANGMEDAKVLQSPGRRESIIRKEKLVRSDLTRSKTSLLVISLVATDLPEHRSLASPNFEPFRIQHGVM